MISSGTEALLEQSGPFCQQYFEAGEEGRKYFLDSKVLVIGAGGLGCELLKSLALTGFKNIHVIDMDIIDISNLNRQFLFRRKDVGQPKSVVAAEFIRKRCPGINITAHFCKIQDMPDEFYKQFHVVIGGLDSVTARTWISRKLVQLAKESHNNEGQIPFIDGGTEEWKGHVKFILPNETACMDCQSQYFVQPTTFQDCTVASFPRQPEHCIIWAKELQWEKLRSGESVDGDNDEHIEWIMEQAIAHANKFGIEGVTRTLTKGVVKNIIPAIASSQAIVAAMCTTEALKLITQTGPNINNNLLFTGDIGVNMKNFEVDRLEECPGCGQTVHRLSAIEGETVAQLMERIRTEHSYPITALRTASVQIYLKIISTTQANLAKPISEFVAPGEQLYGSSREVSEEFRFLFE